MQKNLRAAALSILMLFTTVVITSSWGYAGSETSAHETSVKEVSKGTIVIRTAQEKDFPSLAKVSLLQAMRIALDQVAGVSGDLLKAETEEKNGFLVHTVEVVTSDKSIMEFTIDAGTGDILKRSVDQLDDDKHGEHGDDEDDD